jgi:hypothetical protein
MVHIRIERDAVIVASHDADAHQPVQRGVQVARRYTTESLLKVAFTTATARTSCERSEDSVLKSICTRRE